MTYAKAIALVAFNVFMAWHGVPNKVFKSTGKHTAPFYGGYPIKMGAECFEFTD